MNIPRNFLVTAVAVSSLLSLESPTVKGQSEEISTKSAPAIPVARPGSSAAKRLANHRAKAQLGLAPVTVLGGYPAAQQLAPEAPPKFEGSNVVVDPKAQGDGLRIQHKFADVFRRSDPVPPSRAAHFAWIPRLAHLHHVGWSGIIVGTEQRQDGSAIVKIRIHPYLVSRVMKTYMSDYVEETYFFSGEGIRLLGSDAAVEKPHLRGFPVQ